MSPMEFRVLGPLEASDGTTPLVLGGRKQRALLARLVLDVNRAVPVQRLIDDLWGDDVPASATKMIQIYVSQLRKVLPPDVLLTQPPGYAVEAEPEAVDVVRFGVLRGEGSAALAAGDAATASARLREALALWRGAPLAEFDEPFARVEGAHLEELRLACLQDRIEADLATGQGAELVAELEALVAEHPLREPLHGQLMLALYRAGRQADALAAYERFRRTLDDELGIEPTASVKAMHVAILTQDEALAAAPAPARRAQPVPAGPGFVGRASELAALAAAFDAADAGHGGSVVVVGPAGIGKTRLIQELIALTRGRGALVLTGRCIQLVGTGLPYLPVVDALRPLCGAAAVDGLAEELRELPRLVAGLVVGSPAPAAEPESRAESRVRLFSEVLTVLDRLSTDAPIVLVLEDLHWADESTLDLVAYLAHAVGQRRVLLIASYRSDEATSGDHLLDLVAGLVGSGTVKQLVLEPLSNVELAAIVIAETGGGLSEAITAAILTRCQGNPFFAGELIAAAGRGETALPPALRDVLLAKVGRLDATSRQVLRIAAATGRDVTYPLLAAVMAVDDLALAEALRATVERDVLEPDHATGSFRFRHALFAEAVYGSLLPGERELLHERLARALTEDPGLAATGATAAESAHHWAAAGRPVEALVASLEAAREAEAVSGLTEALRHVERVLELWDDVPSAEELAGFALPTVLDWAAELAGVPAGRDASVSMEEARRLYPSAVVLESLAVRVAPPFPTATLAALREANARFRGALANPVAAIKADDDFHRGLTDGCENPHLLAALRPIKQALMRYESVYMLDPARIERSAAQHDAIVAALERGDQAEAAQLVRENLARGLPDLTDALER